MDNFFLFLQNKTDNIKHIEISSNDEIGCMTNTINNNISVSVKLHNEINDLNKNLEKKDFKSYNEALDSYFTKQVKEEKVDESELRYKKELDKLNKIIDEQKKQIERMQTSIKVNNGRAELIYTNYKLIQGIITELKKAREKYSWKEIKEKLKGHKIIKDINEKESKITIEI